MQSVEYTAWPLKKINKYKIFLIEMQSSTDEIIQQLHPTTGCCVFLLFVFFSLYVRGITPKSCGPFLVKFLEGWDV